MEDDVEELTNQDWEGTYHIKKYQKTYEHNELPNKIMLKYYKRL